MIKEIITLIVFILSVGGILYSILHNNSVMIDFCRSQGFDKISFDNYCYSENTVSSLKVVCSSHSIINPLLKDCKWLKEKEIIEVGK